MSKLGFMEANSLNMKKVSKLPTLKIQLHSCFWPVQHTLLLCLCVGLFVWCFAGASPKQKQNQQQLTKRKTSLLYKKTRPPREGREPNGPSDRMISFLPRLCLCVCLRVGSAFLMNF